MTSEAPNQPSESRLTRKRRRPLELLAPLSLGRYVGVLVGLVLVSSVLAVMEPAFLTTSNLTNMLKANSVGLLLATGATFITLAGVIDLSIAAATTASAMILGIAINAGWSGVTSIAVAITFGLFLGSINGLLVGYLRLSFFIVTLGTLSVFQSFALIVYGGSTISLFGQPGFHPLSVLANDSLGPLPVLLILDAAVVLVAGAVLSFTLLGRKIYAIGSNPDAARLAGVSVRRVMFAVFAVGGTCAGLAAVVQCGRLAGSNSQVDPTLLLAVFASVLIGGTSYAGGEGGMFGTVLGVIFLGVVANGLTLSGVASYWQGAVSGGILILAVVLNAARERRWRLRLPDRIRRRIARDRSGAVRSSDDGQLG